MLNSRGGGMHHLLLSPGTEDFTHFHLHKKLISRSSPNGRVRGFQMTGALHFRKNRDRLLQAWLALTIG